MDSSIVIRWEGKTYRASSWEDLLERLVQDAWFGPMSGFVNRVKEVYGVRLDTSDPKAMFETLEELGELVIVLDETETDRT